MGFYYLENENKIYINEDYLRNRLLTLSPNNKIDSQPSINNNSTLFLKKINIELPVFTSNDCVNILMKNINDDNIDILSGLLSVEKSHLLALAYLLYEGSISIDNIKTFLEMSTNKTRSEYLLSLIKTENTKVNIFGGLFNSIQKLSNVNNKIEASKDRYLNNLESLKKFDISSAVLPYSIYNNSEYNYYTNIIKNKYTITWGFDPKKEQSFLNKIGNFISWGIIGIGLGISTIVTGGLALGITSAIVGTIGTFGFIYGAFKALEPKKRSIIIYFRDIYEKFLGTSAVYKAKKLFDSRLITTSQISDYMMSEIFNQSTATVMNRMFLYRYHNILSKNKDDSVRNEAKREFLKTTKNGIIFNDLYLDNNNKIFSYYVTSPLVNFYSLLRMTYRDNFTDNILGWKPTDTIETSITSYETNTNRGLFLNGNLTYTLNDKTENLENNPINYISDNDIYYKYLRNVLTPLYPTLNSENSKFFSDFFFNSNTKNSNLKLNKNLIKDILGYDILIGDIKESKNISDDLSKKADIINFGTLNIRNAVNQYIESLDIPEFNVEDLVDDNKVNEYLTNIKSKITHSSLYNFTLENGNENIIKPLVYEILNSYIEWLLDNNDESIYFQPKVNFEYFNYYRHLFVIRHSFKYIVDNSNYYKIDSLNNLANYINTPEVEQNNEETLYSTYLTGNVSEIFLSSSNRNFIDFNKR